MNTKLPNIPKKQRSIEAFSHAFFSLLEEIPYDKISVSNIITKSEYSRTAFYSYFLDKEDFVEKLLSLEVSHHVHAIYDYIASHDVLFHSDMYLPALELYKHVYTQRDFYRALIRNKVPTWSLPLFCDECNYYFKNNIHMAIQSITPDLNLDFYQYTKTFQYISFILYWDKSDYAYSPEYMAKQTGLYIKAHNSALVDMIEVY